MNIYRNEFRSYRKSALIWAFSLSALALLFLSVYPTVVSDVKGFRQILENYPAAIREMLGINLDYIGSLIGFYSMSFSFIVLCGAIQAMNLGVSILSRESRERTADFLLVKPVSRSRIITAKLFAALTIIILTDIIFLVFSLITANIVKTDDYSNKLFIMVNLTMFFIQLIFLAAGLLVSLFFRKIRTVLPISLGFVFGLYMAGALISTGKNDKVLRFISPFQYFNIPYIIKNSSYEIKYLILDAAIVIVCVTLSYILYQRKDIHAVS